MISTVAATSPIVAPPPPAAVLARRALRLLLLMLAGVTLAWVALAARNGSGLTHEAGLLTGLAMDTAHGDFYRPLIGANGYGGTRYGPLQIVLQAAMIKTGIPPLVAGQIIALASGAALYLAVRLLLILFGINRSDAAVFPLLLLVTTAMFAALSGIRPDLLAVALNAWGLVFASRLLSDTPSRAALAGAVLLFTAALLAKYNAGAEFATAVICLLMARRVRDGVVLGAGTGLLVVLGFVICNLASHGQLWANYRACANPGGRPRTTFHGWLTLLWEVFIHDDWTGSLLLLAALGGSLLSIHRRPGFTGWLLVVTLLLTLPMYFSPGLSTNHLLDLQLAAVLAAAVWIDRNRRHVLPWLVTGLVVLVSLLQLLRPRVLHKAMYHRLETFRDTLTAAHVEPTLIFSDNALVPVSLGRRPFLLDDFMFPAVRQVRPQAESDLLQRLQQRSFSAVVLRYDPATPARAFVFGPRFAPELLANYQLSGRLNTWDHLWIYLPKPK